MFSLNRCQLLFSHKVRRMFSLLAPHGPKRRLCESLLSAQSIPQAIQSAQLLPSVVLTPRQLCDLELIMNGGLSPLSGFMTQADYESVVSRQCLNDGTLFPIPITLDLKEHQIKEIDVSKSLSLKDEEGNILATLKVEDVWRPNKSIEANEVFGGDPEHPAVNYLMHQAGSVYVGGTIEGIQMPFHYNYADIRHTPAQLRNKFESLGWANKPIVAFQTRNPLHRAHFELTKAACKQVGGNLLLHPVVGMTKPGDIDHHTRIKCYKEIMGYYNPGEAILSGLPLAMRMAGPREAILHAIIRQNYGASHFIIGRDHAGPGSNSKGKDFYGPYEARDAALKVQDKLKIKLIPFEMLVYLPTKDIFMPADQVPQGERVEKLSGTEVRRRLKTGEEIPEWFSFKRVVDILRQAHPPMNKQGVCVFFTGFSGSGKSAIANALLDRLMEVQSRNVTLLDGDVVRQMLSSELSFTAEHRNLNIKRIGYVASLICKSGGLVIAAPIAPYKSSRQFARDLVQASASDESFIEVYVSTPIKTCEKRDRKGLYAKARAGLLKGFTGLDDPYEIPTAPEITLNTDILSIEESVNKIVEHLKKKGFFN